MKKLLITLTLAITLLFATNAMATKTCPPGQEKKGWKCVDIEQPAGGVTVETDIENDVDVRNTNIVTNINSNKSESKSEADAAAAALAIQAQKAEANNEGNTQSIKIEEAKIPTTYNHIPAPTEGQDAWVADHEDVQSVKTLGSILEHIKVLDVVMAKKAAKGGSDVVIEEALLWEPNVQLKNVQLQSKRGTYMGSLTLYTDGPDATKDQMTAAAVVRAAYIGATNVFMTDDEGKFLDAVQYGLSIGAAASVAATGSGSAVLAPGAVTGYSKAKTANEMRPALFVVLYHDADSIVE